MDEPEQMPAVRSAFRELRFVLRWHAHLEMRLERVDAMALSSAGSSLELLEDYPERERGHTKLLLGYLTQDDAIHLVANVEAFEDDPSEPLVVVTVYRPEPPWWTHERTRGLRR